MKRLAWWAALAVFACALTAIGASASAGASDSLTVRTNAGAVRGINDGTVNEWLGVPYAAPPVGPNRWRLPQPVIPWSGIRPAGRFAPDCIQLGLTNTTTEGSENCLYLNVFAPAGTTWRSRLPVMVHLHGGSNFFGFAYKHAKALVDHGVIVVTVGYRLGVFGFAGHPALTAEGHGSSGEYGVLDQIAALHWVHDNIAAFGGNPHNVTLFGESAGSFDAVAIAASPLGRGLFARLAAQTEAFDPGRGTGTIADAESIGLQVARKVGCTGAHALACLRAKPAAKLVVAAGVGDVAPWTGGVVLPHSPLALIAQQRHPVPMLVGSNREEGVFFLQGQGAPVPPQPFTRKDWIKYTNILVGRSYGPRVRQLYPLSRYDSPYWDTVGIYTDTVYTCPMRRLALASRGRVYRYLYTHRYQNNPFLASLRAAHFLDDPILWGDASLLSGFVGNKPYRFSPDERALTARMSTYWTNFAKTGDPNGPGLPRWPLYQPRSERTIVLDQPASQVRSYQVRQCALLDSLPTILP